MNQQPIEQADNADLRGSWPALQRAAERARAIAAQTSTYVVIAREGVIEHIQPQSEKAVLSIGEKQKTYGAGE